MERKRRGGKERKEKELITSSVREAGLFFSEARAFPFQSLLVLGTPKEALHICFRCFSIPELKERRREKKKKKKKIDQEKEEERKDQKPTNLESETVSSSTTGISLNDCSC